MALMVVKHGRVVIVIRMTSHVDSSVPLPPTAWLAVEVNSVRVVDTITVIGKLVCATSFGSLSWPRT